MGAEIINKKETTKMFNDSDDISSDEQLALDIIHRFNICRDTIETMPAFEEHTKPIFAVKKEK